MIITKKNIILLSFFLPYLGCLNISLEKETELFPNGTKKRELTYKGNFFQKKLVNLIDFYSDDQLENPPKYSEFNYENSSLNGEQFFWYRNGTKKMILKYRYGLMHGEQLGWYKNGKSKFIRNFNFGFVDGFQKFYDESGDLDRKKLYNNGKLIRIEKD